MPIINPDTSEQISLEALEPGTYPAEIVAVEYGHAKSSGNPMLTVSFKVTADGKTVTRKSFLVITGAGAFNFDQLLRATGFDELADAYKDKEAEKPQFDTDDLIGQQLNVVIDHELYNGETRDRIKSYLRA